MWVKGHHPNLTRALASYGFAQPTKTECGINYNLCWKAQDFEGLHIPAEEESLL